MIRPLLLLLCALAIAGIDTSAQKAGALTIFYNGKIFTSDGAHPLIEDGGVAVVGNVIVKVGNSESLLQLAVPGAELIDLDGKVLLPGFNDAHVHPFDSFTFPQFGTGAVVVNDNRFVPGPGPSFQDVLTALQAAARVNPPGTWLMAFIGTQVLDDSSVDRLAIDAVAPDHPVLLSAWFGHGTFINTKAIQTLGLSLVEADPAGGFFGRSPTGELDGEVREYAEHHIRRFFANQMTDEQLVNAYRALCQPGGASRIYDSSRVRCRHSSEPPPAHPPSSEYADPRARPLLPAGVGRTVRRAAGLLSGTPVCDEVLGGKQVD